MKQYKSWEEFERKDLQIIPTMESKGFEVIFNTKDKIHNRTTVTDWPQFSVSFKRDKLHIWSVRDGIRVATLFDLHYENHFTINSYQALFETFRRRRYDDVVIIYTKSMGKILELGKYDWDLAGNIISQLNHK